MSNTPAPCDPNSNRRGCVAFFIARHGIDLETPFGRGAVVDPVLTTHHGAGDTSGGIVGSGGVPPLFAPQAKRQPIVSAPIEKLSLMV